MPIERFTGRSAEALTPGKHQITVDTKIAKPAAPADVVIAVDGGEALRVAIARTVPGAFSASETFDVGMEILDRRFRSTISTAPPSPSTGR